MQAVNAASLVDAALAGRDQLDVGQVVSVACDLADIGELKSKKRRIAVDYCHKLTCKELGIHDRAVRARSALDDDEHMLLEELAWRAAEEWQALTRQLGAVAWAGPLRRQQIILARELVRRECEPPPQPLGPRQRLSALAATPA